METEETKVPSIISNRPVRILLLGVALIVVCVVLVGIGITLLRSSRSSPISVDIYPGALLISNSHNNRQDSSLYSTQDSVQQVFDFYDQRVPKELSDGVYIQGCQKIYTDGNAATREQPGHYFARCVEDNSQLDVVQQLLITINYQMNDDTKKLETRFEIYREWGAAS